MATSNPRSPGGNVPVLDKGESRAGFWPDHSASYPNNDVPVAEVAVGVDSQGNLATRGPVLTDEGSFRDDFSGSSLNTPLTGTFSFTNGMTNVTGTGTSFLSEVHGKSNYIKLDAHGESAWAQVAQVLSDTELTLVEGYTGATASGAASKTMWPTITGAGGAVTVSTSEVLIASGTTSGSNTRIAREIDYLPLILEANVRVTQRIANQEAWFGYRDDDTAPQMQAVVIFDGTVNTTVKFRTSFSSAAADTQETVVTLPPTTTSAASLAYRIVLSAGSVALYINDTLMAYHRVHLPDPYAPMRLSCGILNTGVPASTTTIAADVLFTRNADTVETEINFSRGSKQSVGITQEVVSSTSNNSTTPLGATGVFTGAGETTTNVAGIQVNVFSNVNSVAGGLQVQQSMDNVNWDIVDRFTVLAGVGRSFTIQATASFFRIVYTNGPSAQAAFRLQVALCPTVEALPRAPTDGGALSVETIEYPTFIATVFGATIGNNKSMLSLALAAGSPYVVRIREIWIINTQTSAVTGVVADFRQFRFATHSAGTVVVPLPRDTQDTLDASITALTGATIAGEVAAANRRWLWSTDEWGPGSLDAEAYEHAVQSLTPAYIAHGGGEVKPIVIRPGEGVHIKHVVNSTAGTFDVMMVFTQEAR